MGHVKNFNNFLKESEDIEKYLLDECDKIESISSYDELYEKLSFLTMGFLAPLNPSEPIRSILRSKVEEILESELDEKKIAKLEQLQKMLEGEQKQFNIPPGAMI
jgi:hypothetical protein